MQRRIVTLLTDFGYRDGYVAQMKAVILRLCDACQIVDISHAVPPQNIPVAAHILRQTAIHFSPGSIHVAVVDPGVGTSRRILAAEIAGQTFVLPDNGLLSNLLDDFPLTQCVQLDNPSYWLDEISHTFHGRDIMAPVAAHLASGISLGELGPPATELCRLPAVRCEAGEILITQVIDIDSFGNLLLADPQGIRDWLVSRSGEIAARGELQVRVAAQWHAARLATTYEASHGQGLILLEGSQGGLELAIPGGSAEAYVQAKVAGKIELRAAS